MSLSPLASLPLLYLAKEDPARSGTLWSAFVAADKLVDAARSLYDQGYHIEDVSGLDAAEGLVAVYHFDHFKCPGRVTLRVIVSHDAPDVPSIAHIFPGAEWHERETTDFYGIRFTGNPNPIPLLLPDDMSHVVPLRKDEGARASLNVLLTTVIREELQRAENFHLLQAETEEETPPAEESAPVKPQDSIPAREAAAAPGKSPVSTAESAPASAPQGPEASPSAEAVKEGEEAAAAAPDVAGPEVEALNENPAPAEVAEAIAKETGTAVTVREKGPVAVKASSGVAVRNESSLVVKAEAPLAVKGDASVTVTGDSSLAVTGSATGDDAASAAGGDSSEKKPTPTAPGKSDTTKAARKAPVKKSKKGGKRGGA